MQRVSGSGRVPPLLALDADVELVAAGSRFMRLSSSRWESKTARHPDDSVAVLVPRRIEDSVSAFVSWVRVICLHFNGSGGCKPMERAISEVRWR